MNDYNKLYKKDGKDMSLASYFEDRKLRKAINEMMRVCKEVRIFPVVDLDANQTNMISDVIDEFKKKYDVELKATNYQFQKNANKMLLIQKTKEVVEAITQK